MRHFVCYRYKHLRYCYYVAFETRGKALTFELELGLNPNIETVEVWDIGREPTRKELNGKGK